MEDKTEDLNYDYNHCEDMLPPRPCGDDQGGVCGNIQDIRKRLK